MTFMITMNTIFIYLFCQPPFLEGKHPRHKGFALLVYVFVVMDIKSRASIRNTHSFKELHLNLLVHNSNPST